MPSCEAPKKKRPMMIIHTAAPDPNDATGTSALRMRPHT